MPSDLAAAPGVSSAKETAVVDLAGESRSLFFSVGIAGHDGAALWTVARLSRGRVSGRREPMFFGEMPRCCSVPVLNFLMQALQFPV